MNVWAVVEERRKFIDKWSYMTFSSITYLITLCHLRIRWKRVHGRDLEGVDRGLFQGIILSFMWRDGEKP
jgi:hypothetical protein